MEELIKRVQNDPLLKAKLQMLALAAEFGSVTLACEKAGFSRDTFYRVKKRFEEGGVEGLAHRAKGKTNPRARISAEVELRIVNLARSSPNIGKMKLSKILRAEGILVSASGVRLVLERNGLWSTERRAELVNALRERVGSVFG